MKRLLIITVCLTGLSLSDLTGQSWRHNQDIFFGKSNYHTDHFNYKTHHSYAYRNEGVRRHLSRKDSRRLARLEKDLFRTRQKALRDGFISRREIRKIREIQKDISVILAHSYGRNNRHNRKFRYHNTCR